MDYKKFLKIEIFFKILSKGVGLGKSFLLLLIFGFSAQLDSHYFAMSLVGIILSIPVVYELLYMSDIKRSIEANDIDFIQNSFLQLIVISIICSLITLIFIVIFYDIILLYHVIILLFWTLFFIVNSFNILVLRVNHRYKTIGLYFLLFPLFVSIFVALAYYVFYFKNSIIVSVSILLAEALMVIYFNQKIAFKYLNLSKVKALKFFNKERFIQTITSFSLIIAVYIIDVTDKSFSYKLEGGYTTVLIYGGLLPLMIRQALDFKSVFYHKLQESNSIKEDLIIFNQTLKWLLYLLLPIMTILFSIFQFINYKHLSKLFNFNELHFEDLMNVLFIYIFILPVYIIWDMIYRIYYKNKFLNKLFFIMLVGVILNYLLNYMFVYYFHMKASGIAFSTLLVLSIYCVYSFIILKVYANKELNIN